MADPAEVAAAGAKAPAALPMGSVEKILEVAPKGLIEETIDVPEWSCRLKLRSFTAGQRAQIRQAGLMISGGKGGGPDVAWAEMEIIQFHLGVREPRFTEEQTRQLHATGAPGGFARVIAWLDQHSGIDKEELRRAREEFPGSED